MSQILGSKLKRFPYVIEDFTTGLFYTESDYQAIVRQRQRQVCEQASKPPKVNANNKIIDEVTGIQLTREQHDRLTSSTITDGSRLVNGIGLLRQKDQNDYERVARKYASAFHKPLSYEEYKKLRDSQVKVDSVEMSGVEFVESQIPVHESKPLMNATDLQLMNLLEPRKELSDIERMSVLAQNSQVLKNVDVQQLKIELVSKLENWEEIIQKMAETQQVMENDAKAAAQKITIYARNQQSEFTNFKSELRKEVDASIVSQMEQIQLNLEGKLRDFQEELKAALFKTLTEFQQNVSAQLKNAEIEVKIAAGLRQIADQTAVWQKSNVEYVQSMEKQLFSEVDRLINQQNGDLKCFESLNNERIAQLQAQISQQKQINVEQWQKHGVERALEAGKLKQQFEAVFDSLAGFNGSLDEIQLNVQRVDDRVTDNKQYLQKQTSSFDQKLLTNKMELSNCQLQVRQMEQKQFQSDSEVIKIGVQIRQLEDTIAEISSIQQQAPQQTKVQGSRQLTISENLPEQEQKPALDDDPSFDSVRRMQPPVRKIERNNTEFIMRNTPADPVSPHHKVKDDPFSSSTDQADDTITTLKSLQKDAVTQLKSRTVVQNLPAKKQAYLDDSDGDL